FSLFWGNAQKAAWYRRLGLHQVANHLPGTFELGRKDSLSRNVQQACRNKGNAEFGFFLPLSLSLSLSVSL
ncbi:tubulin-tyrosine ligase/Tubulin polyglutamylase, partial [Kipferlia bialata]